MYDQVAKLVCYGFFNKCRDKNDTKTKYPQILKSKTETSVEFAKQKPNSQN